MVRAVKAFMMMDEKLKLKLKLKDDGMRVVKKK